MRHKIAKFMKFKFNQSILISDRFNKKKKTEWNRISWTTV